MAIFGKSLSQYQAPSLLNTWHKKPIILLFDHDAQAEMATSAANLRANDAVVVEARLPAGYDPGDYDRRTLWNIIDAQARAVGVILPRL